MPTRIDARFAELKKQGRSAFVTFLMAGDPDPATALAVIKALPQAKFDVLADKFTTLRDRLPDTAPAATETPTVDATGIDADLIPY